MNIKIEPKKKDEKQILFIRGIEPRHLKFLDAECKRTMMKRSEYLNEIFKQLADHRKKRRKK